MRKVINQEVRKINKSNKILIADPSYLDDPKLLAKPHCVFNKIFDKLTDSNDIAIFKELEINEDNLKYKCITVNIIVGELYGQNGHVLKESGIGCDTACFCIETDHGYDEFHTGADGAYGYYKYTESGYEIELSFDASLFTFDEIVHRITKLF